MWIMNYTYKDIYKRIKKSWFTLRREWKWSHEMWTNKEWIIIILPNHGWKNISKWVIKSIITDLWLTNQEFKDLV